MLVLLQFRNMSEGLVGDSPKHTKELLTAENPQSRFTFRRWGSTAGLISSWLELLQAVALQFTVVSAGYHNMVFIRGPS